MHTTQGSLQKIKEEGKQEGDERISDDATEWSDSDGSDETDSEEFEEREAQRELREQQLAYLAEHWRHDELVKLQVRCVRVCV